MNLCRFVVVLGLLLTTVASEARNISGHPGCEVAIATALETIEDYSGPDQIFSAEPPPLTDLLRSGWWAAGSDPPVRVRPPLELLARFDSEGNVSAVRHCASLRRMLDSRGIAHGAKADRAWQRLSRRKRQNVRILRMSLPFVSPDGRRALFAFSHSGAGATIDLVERRSDGRWRLVAYSPLAVY